MPNAVVVTLVLLFSLPDQPELEVSRPMASVDECFQEAKRIVDNSAPSMMRLGGGISVMCDMVYSKIHSD